MIKYLAIIEKYTYRGDHEILELHCIFYFKIFHIYSHRIEEFIFK